MFARGGRVVEQNKSAEQEPKRRRSTRIVHAVPLAVAGEDALGQPFKERTSTLIVSCHGCRYQSKHYVPRNGVVELEVQHPEPGHPARRVRARVSWIQRPRTVRELFQVGVEIAVPGNVWGVAFPPDDWFPWPDQPADSAGAPAPASEQPPAPPEPVRSIFPVPADESPAPESVPEPSSPPPVSDKVRTMPRPEPPAPPAPPRAESAEPAARQVEKIVAEARRQIQEDVKKIVAAVVNAESSQINAAMTSQLRVSANEAVKQALMSHGQLHAERLDVALREALARLEIVRYESARAMKEHAELETKTAADASTTAKKAADEALAQALARLESARDETARALSMQSRAEGQRVMAQAASRMEELMRQSLGKIEQAGRSSSERLTEAARAEMQQSVSGALDSLRADIAGTSNEVRRMAAEELESARNQLNAARDAISAGAQTAATQALAGLDARVESTRTLLADLAREAGELDAAISHKLGAGRGEWQQHVDRELAAARLRWEELVAQSLAGSTESLRARLDEAAAAAIAPAIENLKRQIEAQAAAAQEALDSVQSEAGHAVTRMREAAAETGGASQRSVVEAQHIFGELESALEARAAAARATVDALRGALDAHAAEARAGIDSARASFEGRTAEIHSGLDAARDALQARASELHAALESAGGSLDSRVGELHKGLDSARGALEARAAELHGGLDSTRSAFESRAAEIHSGLDGLRAALESESRRLESLLAGVRDAHERVQSTIGDLDSLRAAATERIRRELEEGLRARSQEMDEHARHVWRQFEANTAPALEAAGRDSLDKFRLALESEIREKLEPQFDRVTETTGRLQASEAHAEQVLINFRERLQDATDAAVRDTAALLQERVARIEREFSESGRDATARMLAEIEEKADDTTHKTFEAFYKASEWYQKKTQTALQSAMDRSLDQSLSALREKAGEMSSLFASELEHFSRSYAEHTRALLEEAAAKVKQTAQGEIEVATEAARTHVVDETRRLAEQQVERARRATEFAAGEVIARVSSQAHDAEAAAAEASVRAVEQLEERAARTRSEMEALHANSTATFAGRLSHEIAQSLVRAQAELDRALEPVLERWQAERIDLHNAWKSSLGDLGGTALDEHREHLSNVANSLMATTVASLSEHSQTILDQLTRDAEQRVRQSCAQVFSGLGEVFQQRLGALAKDIAPAPGGSTPAGEPSAK
ncbi:MAG TPA: hypothetical protein VMI93_01030 [Candidatus Solibacter sp.]|nr:hypothetical protein [Candidatus Solibacter sp.]